MKIVAEGKLDKEPTEELIETLCRYEIYKHVTPEKFWDAYKKTKDAGKLDKYDYIDILRILEKREMERA